MNGCSLWRVTATVTAVSLALVLMSCGDSATRSDGDTSPIHKPWPNEEAEILALIASGEIVAPVDLYDLICEDLDRVEAEWCESIPVICEADEGGDYFPLTPRTDWGVGELWIKVDDTTLEAMQLGTYDAWDNLNEYYLLDSALVGQSTRVHLRFVPRLNPTLLISEYESLPGVIEAGVSNWLGGAPSGLVLSLSEDARLYQFCAVSVDADCEAGCGCSYEWQLRVTTDSIVLVNPMGNLQVYVQDQFGETCSDMKVLLYEETHHKLDSGVTKPSWFGMPPSWTRPDLPAGMYIVEAWNKANGDYWGDKDVTTLVMMTAVTLTRHSTYATALTVPSEISLGTNAPVTVRVFNGESDVAMPTQVKLQIDRDQMSPYDFEEIAGTFIVPTLGDKDFAFEYTPGDTGTYHISAISASDYGQGVLNTDTRLWGWSFRVVP